MKINIQRQDPQYDACKQSQHIRSQYWGSFQSKYAHLSHFLTPPYLPIMGLIKPIPAVATPFSQLWSPNVFSRSVLVTYPKLAQCNAGVGRHEPLGGVARRHQTLRCKDSTTLFSYLSTPLHVVLLVMNFRPQRAMTS